MKIVKKISKNIIEVFSELRRHKIGLLGLTVLIIEISMIMFFPYVADQQAIESWGGNLKYFEKNPKLAPPIWSSYLFPWERPPTTQIEPQIVREDFDFNKFEGDDGYYAFYLKYLGSDRYIVINGTRYDLGDESFVRENDWPKDRERYSRVTIIRIIYPYNFYHSRPPIDVIFSLNLTIPSLKVSEVEFSRYSIGVFIHRPDGITLSLVPGSTYPKNIYRYENYNYNYTDLRSYYVRELLNIESRSFRENAVEVVEIVPRSKLTLSLDIYAYRLLLLGETRYKENFIHRIIYPLLKVANETEKFGRGRMVDLVELAFSKAEPGLLEGRSGKLNGRYIFEFLFIFTFRQGEDYQALDIKADNAVIGGGWGLLGTDIFGRDLWSGIIYGIRWALLLGVVVALITNLTGALYGVTSAYFGGKVDLVMQQIYRIYVSIPTFPILIMLSWSIGSSIWLLMSLMIIFGLTAGQYTVRSMALQIREQTYVEAARALGASHARIVMRYIYPQVAPYLFASIALSVPGAILTEAALSFLGLGDPRIVTWGKILEDAANKGAFIQGAWWWVVFPGLAIVITSLAFIMFGQAIEKIIEPRLRTR